MRIPVNHFFQAFDQFSIGFEGRGARGLIRRNIFLFRRRRGIGGGTGYEITVPMRFRPTPAPGGCESSMRRSARAPRLPRERPSAAAEPREPPGACSSTAAGCAMRRRRGLPSSPRKRERTRRNRPLPGPQIRKGRRRLRRRRHSIFRSPSSRPRSNNCTKPLQPATYRCRRCRFQASYASRSFRHA